MRRVLGSSAPRIAGTATACAAVLLLAVPGAGAQAGGAAYSSSASGGAAYGALLTAARPPRPVARVFGLVPVAVTAPALPRVRLRVDQPSARTVRARLSLVPVPAGGSGSAVVVDLGRVPTGREVSVAWPATVAPAPGRYAVRLWVKGRGGRLLARGAGASSGRANLTVRPAPVVTPEVPLAGAPALTAGVFPVRGPHTYGEGIGAARRGHTHEGQDVAAAAGTPVVAPVSGTVAKVAFQAGGAGWYVVERADDGRDFFFAHCRTGSVAVARGARVAAGATLCAVGSTGSATGPHLHFEIWPGGWRTTKASRPIDPLPQLQAWDG
jgi:murein DD-endopeptidase MepM/ murein hydrolase activator NlpD